LWNKICSIDNLELAYQKARKGKTTKGYVIEFEKNLEINLADLRIELLSEIYKPSPLETFILRDPKTRVISKSDFRDRIIHHAIVNVLEPIFDKSFIFDSYANRKGKGTLKAIKRFDEFMRKVSKNNSRECFVLKADIKHYFEEVNHDILLQIIKRKISDKRGLHLIKEILDNTNFESQKGRVASEIYKKGMPLGNLTSQFFANIYLNELDNFIKRILRVKFYVRYVDDFIILHKSKEQLEKWKKEIDCFLREKLRLELHPQKSRVIYLSRGVDFVGFRNFYHFKLLRKRNVRKMKNKILLFDKDEIILKNLSEILQGWQAYAKLANTYKLRKQIRHSIIKIIQSKIIHQEDLQT